ncbi:MAG: hypothetical protein QM761_08515 [Pseudoxanthomonas sp.]
MAARQPHDCDDGARLAALLRAGAIDAAIEAGLMDYVPCPDCDADAAAGLLAAQRRLSTAWAARERYRAREARLARIAAERAARRAPPQAQKTALPPAAALALARAKARAARRDDQ